MKRNGRNESLLSKNSSQIASKLLQRTGSTESEFTKELMKSELTKSKCQPAFACLLLVIQIHQRLQPVL
jgi:hypothetical protein